MDLVRLYKRALGMLAAEKWPATALALASVAIGLVQLAEPILFGRVVDALSRGGDVFLDDHPLDGARSVRNSG